MKKFLSAFVALMLVFSMLTAAFAADIDFMGMTDDEVIEMTKACQQELVDRGIGKSAELNNGYYVAGYDIPAGSYIASIVAAEETEESNRYYGNQKGIAVYNSIEDMDEGNPVWYDSISTKDAEHQMEVAFNLKDGQYLMVDGEGTVKITITTGVEFK